MDWLWGVSWKREPGPDPQQYSSSRRAGGKAVDGLGGFSYKLAQEADSGVTVFIFLVIFFFFSFFFVVFSNFICAVGLIED